jgi:hypothetical protein
MEDNILKLKAHAEQLVEALRDIAYGSDAKPRARAALAQWEEAQK